MWIFNRIGVGTPTPAVFRGQLYIEMKSIKIYLHKNKKYMYTIYNKIKKYI